MTETLNTHALTLSNVSCKFGSQTVVDNVSFNIAAGEIFCLLGPSGCGKTTTLRAIAGFEDITSGEISLFGQTISNSGNIIPPHKRKIGMVFQDYALFPHLSVADNIAFGLDKASKSEKKNRVSELLELIGLSKYTNQFPHELSGGQQQRVSLARALAPSPQALLMDEPFSNLDVKLRERLLEEVTDLLKSQNVTSILVTHDQHEAFAMCDRVAVMNEGKIEQVDTSYNLYHQPKNRFVANFVGISSFVPAIVKSTTELDTPFGVASPRRGDSLQTGQTVDLLVRPDDFQFNEHSKYSGIVKKRFFRGAEILYILEINQQFKIYVSFPSHYDFEIGEKVGISAELKHVITFPTQ